MLGQNDKVCSCVRSKYKFKVQLAAVIHSGPMGQAEPEDNQSSDTDSAPLRGLHRRLM